MARNKYESGRNAEKKVAAQLRRHGASVTSSPRSRGAADLVAKFPGRQWMVQVKSGENPPSQLHGTEKQRLNSTATRRNSTPVLARVTDNGVEYVSTRSGRRLKP